MKKLKLNRAKPEEFTIIGIVCPKPDYWLALHINNKLGFNLRREKDVPIYQDTIDTLLYFPFFMFFDEWNRRAFLLKNRVSKNFIFSKFKNFDYFLLLDAYSLRIKEINIKLKEIPSVIASITFPLGSIPRIDYFMEDFEMHLIDLSNVSKFETKKKRD